jgi:6-phosphogluconolactonase
MPEAELRAFPSRHALDGALAASVALALSAAMEERGGASLVVSGGSTPAGFFRALARQDLDWARLTVTVADERWVAPAHADSNERLVQEALLAGPAAKARFLSLWTTHEHPGEAESTVAERLRPLGSFDVVVLGMGTDGHFASLFPGSAALARGLALPGEDPCVAVDPPAAAHARLSLSLARLRDTRHLFVHIVGEEKRALLERAAAAMDPSTLPIAAVLALDEPAATVYWAP